MSLARALLLLGVVAAGLACGGGQEAPPEAQPEPEPVTETPPPAPAGESGPRTITGHVRVIDLEGQPLAGMAPIVTRRANAFDPPLATGPLTGEDGHASFQFPIDERVHIRAWDPELRYFPNTFYTVLPADGDATHTLDLVMVEGASLGARLLGPGGEPIAGETVRLMLEHPTEGPWWPTDAVTNEDGYVLYDAVPAGEYLMRFQSASGLALETPGVALRPGGAADLGELTLF